MTQIAFSDPASYQALTLTERIVAFRAGSRSFRNGHVPSERARQRLQNWRGQTPFTSEARFSQRLAQDGIREDELLFLLEESSAFMDGASSPWGAWWADVARAFADPAPAEMPNLAPSETPRIQEAAGFLALVAPLLKQARARLEAVIQELVQTHAEHPFDPDVAAGLLFSHLPGSLIRLVSRTLVLELHVARLQELLEGETPEERFQSFGQRLRQHDIALALFHEYPVLARQVVLCIDNWLRFSLEFLQHLCDDWQTLRVTFSPEQDPGLLAAVKGGVGDKHRGGRSVLIAKFASGLQVVYKPKPLAVDVHVQELLAWVNARGNQLPFRIMTILDRGSYGWVEFVAAHGCTCEEEVRRFYERQGGYLALLYALEATDFHHENLIAAGEHPVLIDLESLFHSRRAARDLGHSEQLAGQTMAHSVLRIGLLPQYIGADGESEGIDLSGLGGKAGQMTPQAVPSWEAAGTDAMRFTRKRLPLPGAQNRPTLTDAKVEVLDYADAIIQGFTAIYRLLEQHQEELLSATGPLARFANDEVRVILRATRTYGLLLQESFHPDVLRDALERDLLFDKLWVAVEHLPHLAQVIPAERDDLLNGDIPFFTTRPATRDVWTSANERLTNYLDEPGLDLVRRRVEQLGDKDLRQQLWFIRAALATLARAEERASEPSHDGREPQTLATRDRLLAAARAAGDRLEEQALRGDQNVSWIGLTLRGGRQMKLMPLGPDLYGGLPGVALFLAHLGAITNEERYTHLARAALATLQRQLEHTQSGTGAIGGFSGWGGILYTFTHLSALWQEPALGAEALKVVERLPALIERDEVLDIIGGTAGCLASLLSLYRYLPSEGTRAAAFQCGARLLARAQAMKQGVAWLTPVAPADALAGFSHGAAGIAWALTELAALTGDERFRSTALAAVAYERSLFSPEKGNWPDLRDPTLLGLPPRNSSESFMVAWCHGAAGIGLARLLMLRHLDDAEIRAEIKTALDTTLGFGLGRNHSLCHGALGNIELLLQASMVFEDSGWQAEVGRRAALILESIERDDWLCGNPLGVETPGLMTGLAGIGYGLLRLAEPQRVPAVLALAPPVQEN